MTGLWLQAMKVGRSLRTEFQGKSSKLVPCNALGTDERIWDYVLDGFDRKTSALLLLLHQELQAGSVGLKGHGFFTCSYGFIATVSPATFILKAFSLVLDCLMESAFMLQVFGMISTYSVIVIQFHNE